MWIHGRKWLIICLCLALIVGVVPLASAASVQASKVTFSKTGMTIYLGTKGSETTPTIAYTIVPSGATAKSDIGLRQWSTDNKKVATVSDKGVVTAVGVGSTYIRLKLLDGSGKSAKCKVTVKKQYVSAISLNTTRVVKLPGSTLQLKATLSPSTAFSTAFTWSSSNKKKATVSKNGLVKCLKPGQVQITCKAKKGGAKQTCTVIIGYDFKNVKYRVFCIANTDYPDVIKQKPYYSENSEEIHSIFSEMMNDDELAMQVNYWPDRTGAQIREHFRYIGENTHTKADDISIVYFGGRGEITTVKGNKGALVGIDADKSSSLVTIEYIRQQLDKSPGTIILILDSNRAGQFIQSKGVTSQVKLLKDNLAFNNAVIDEFSKSVATNYSPKSILGDTKSKYKIITACSALQNSYGVVTSEDDDEDEEAYAYFSRAVALALTGKADYNKDGIITMSELKKYTANRVKADINKYNKKHKKKIAQTVKMWPSSDNMPVYVMQDLEYLEEEDD